MQQLCHDRSGHAQVFAGLLAGRSTPICLSDVFHLQECFVLLCWTAVVLRQLQVSTAKKAVIKLVECQVCSLLPDMSRLSNTMHFHVQLLSHLRLQEWVVSCS